MPDLVEIEAEVCKAEPPIEVTDALIYATWIFRKAVGRYPSPAELLAGLLRADTDAAVFSSLLRDAGTSGQNPRELFFSALDGL